MRRLIFKKSTILAILTVGLCVAGFQLYRIYSDAQNKLAQTRSRLIEQNIVTFEKLRLTPHLDNNVRIIQNTNDTRALIRFQDSYFAATSGGLLQLSPDGKKIKHFTVLDGLPESSLTALAVFDAKLFIGTQTKNILTFDGESFIQYHFPERQAEAITTFLNDNGRLLIGTFSGGLMEFDGENFREIKAENQTIKGVTFLKKTDTSLFVGTFNNGLWLYENDVWKHFTTAEGLPSNRIIGAVKNTKNLLVATDFGLSVLENEKFRTVKVLPMISSLEEYKNQIYVSTEDGEIYIFNNQLTEIKETINAEKSRLTAMDNSLFLLTNHGVFRDFNPFSKMGEEELADNFVSAMAFDKNGNLWVGTFRNGIDVFTAEGKKVKHIENDNLREINNLQLQSNTVLAATSKGLWSFKPDFSVENMAKGSITHFTADAVSTSKGLKIGEKLLTNINGLPSNSTYTTLRLDKKLYVGTLGGLAEIEHNKVVKTFTDANSRLTNNWITSLCSANERVFIGTYGGGILELTPSGELHSFLDDAGKFVVNPNSIFSDGERLYAGTLSGVKILNLQTNKWLTIKNILPAEAVFAIGSDGKSIYFATTNGIAKVEKSYFDQVER